MPYCPVTAKVELTDSNQCATPDGKKFQGVGITIPELITSAFVPQEIWDRLTQEQKEDAPGYLAGTFDSCIYGWIQDWVDVVTSAPTLEYPFGKKVEG